MALAFENTPILEEILLPPTILHLSPFPRLKSATFCRPSATPLTFFLSFIKSQIPPPLSESLSLANRLRTQQNNFLQKMFRLTTTLLFALLLQQQFFSSRANPNAKRAVPSAENENGREASSSSSPTERPRPALKMLGPFPLGPGQKGSVKTDYFDPKTYSTKDLRDFHRLTEGLNADIRRMVEETDRIRRTAAVEAEALREQLAAHQQQQNGADGSAAAAELFPHQHLALLLITLTALAVTLLALALANLMLIKTALRHLRGTAADGTAKSGLLLEQGQ